MGGFGEQPASGQHASECEFYASLLEGLPVPVWLAGPDGDLRYANAAWLTFTGRSSEMERGAGWLEGVAAEERVVLERALREAAREARPLRFEYHLRRADGQARWVETQASPVRGRDGRIDGYVGWTTDLTEHRRQEAQLAFMATHDPLTGLPNRRLLEEPLKRVVARARRGTPSALLLLDLDNFKYYNDALGHIEGDQALINLALLLQTHIRAGDLLVRMGGDEFAVLLEGAGVDEALDIAERMRAASEREFVPRARDFGLSISVGLLMIDGEIDHRRLLGLADTAMYRAKETGRNRVVLHTGRDDVEHMPAGTLATRLRDAFRKDLFVVHFQPVVHIRDGEVDYHEALIRLSADGGDAGVDSSLKTPAEFLPAAERFGLMARLTRRILDTVVRTLAEDDGARIAVNLSSMDMADMRLPDDVSRRLGDAGVAPDRLLFEVSESVVTQDLAAAEVLLGALCRVGCGLVLEDFGRAFTSLGMLRGLSVERVKIDGSLVASLEDEPGQIALMSAVRTLVETQGKRAIIECVETDGQLERVRKAGFEYAQGNILARPAPRLAHALVSAGG